MELIRHFNEFHEAVAHGKGHATAIRLLGFLADYSSNEECPGRDRETDAILEHTAPIGPSHHSRTVLEAR